MNENLSSSQNSASTLLSIPRHTESGVVVVVQLRIGQLFKVTRVKGKCPFVVTLVIKDSLGLGQVESGVGWITYARMLL